MYPSNPKLIPSYLTHNSNGVYPRNQEIYYTYIIRIVLGGGYQSSISGGDLRLAHPIGWSVSQCLTRSALSVLTNGFGF